MSQLELFDLEEWRSVPEARAAEPERRCLGCRHRQRWQMGGAVVSYCGARRSGRTRNRLLKVKGKREACALWEPVVRRLDRMWEADVYHYSAADEAEIDRRQGRVSDAEIGERLNRTAAGIRSKRRRMKRKGGGHGEA